jgi:hypothetical protein
METFEVGRRAVSEPVQRGAARINPPCERVVPRLLKLRAGCRYQLGSFRQFRAAVPIRPSSPSVILVHSIPVKGAALIKQH